MQLSGPGAAAVPLRPHRRPPGCPPARGAGLRSCGSPCPSPAAGSREVLAPRRAPPPAPRRSVPSTAPRPRSADARDGPGVDPAEVAARGAPAHLSPERERRVPAAQPRAGSAPRPPPRPARRPSRPLRRSPGRRARPRPLGSLQG